MSGYSGHHDDHEKLSKPSSEGCTGLVTKKNAQRATVQNSSAVQQVARDTWHCYCTTQGIHLHSLAHSHWLTCDGWRMHVTTFFFSTAPRAWHTPMVVVDLPNVIQVSGRRERRSRSRSRNSSSEDADDDGNWLLRLCAGTNP